MSMPALPPNIEVVIGDLIHKEKISGFLSSNFGITDNKHRYLHWDKLRFLPPPTNYSNEEWWAGIKLAREKAYRKTGLDDSNEKPFVFLYSDEILQDLHWLDQNTSGMVVVSPQIINAQTKNTYLIRSLIEESISSSQLEGASTTSRVAKEMLREGRKPENNSEQMIYNNFLGMKFILNYKEEKLTPDILLELHRILTKDTLDSEHDSGRFRNKSDNISIVNYNGDVVFTPPSATLLPSRINNLCDFANSKQSKTFIHPVIKAILLHFFLAFEHPFVDGNGRTARALFYWSMAQENYWLMEFIAISKIIKKAPIKYGTAFLHTETDQNDTTYFIIHQINVIKEAIMELNQYIERKTTEIASTENLLSTSIRLKDTLNFRQLALVKHAMKHPGFTYKISQYQHTHGIAYDTARTDMSDLAEKFGFLLREKKGKGYIFRSPQDLINRIQKRNK